MPIGTILPYIGSLANIPRGWHLCDGTDGTPNLLDNRFLEGSATIGTFKNPGLPNIIGYNLLGFAWRSSGAYVYQGAYEANAVKTTTANLGMGFYNFYASSSNSIYGSSSTVQPKAYTVLYIIKIK